jgi:hypothetical protein
MVHGMNPYAIVCGFGAGMRDYPPERACGQPADIPTIAGQIPLAPGVTLAFEPNCVINGKLASIGGTVIIGDDGPVELNPFTAQLLRA